MKTRFWIIALAVAAGLFWREFLPAQAVMNPSCAGNVCAGNVSVGGQVVAYAWTQNHEEGDASLKVRFTSGPYSADADPVRFKITVDKAFSGNASLKNPSPVASLPPDQAVNIPKTIIERSSGSSAAGVTYDFTQDLRYVSPVPGTISITLELSQYGATQIVGPFSVYLDASSPSNRDEGASLSALFGPSHRQCYDGVDNDLDYRLDCADSDCTGESISPTQVCESPEQTCNDGLDNDGNGELDCADPLCNGRPGNLAGTKFCGSENAGAAHANCADAFDNDGNGELDCADDDPGTGCWKSGFQDCAAVEISCVDDIDNDRDQDYGSAVDTSAGTGIDCRDYDCEGQGNCTVDERMRWDIGSGTFVDAPAQCFDGLDDDLDEDVDCADIDCLGASFGASSCASFEAYLPPSPLGDGTVLPAFYFNLCDDGIDNDGNALIDEFDPDCRNVFGQCGPSPGQEDYTFLSCSDAVDDDLDTVIDCADAECRANRKIGRSGCTTSACGSQYATLATDVAICSASENDADYCGDGIDNDGDGQIDCADVGCTAPAQRHGPTVGSVASSPYFCGAESGAVTCHDGANNDSDAGADCFDAACQDGVQCKQRPGAGGWTLAASCPDVPHTTALAPIVSGGNTLYAHDDRIYASSAYRIRFTGSGSYTSLTIVIGDGAVAANAFPFDAGAGNCSLSGAGASQLQYASPSSGVGVITEKYGETVAGFDVTLSCASSSAVPLGPEDYKISTVANRSGSVEFGEATPSVQVFEHSAPTLPAPAVEVEGIVAGKVSVPVGATVRLQATPNADPSGICRCEFDLEGAGYTSPDGNCVATVGPFANDNAAYDIAAAALDGAANVSATSTQTIDVNVVPSVDENLVLGTDVNGSTVLTYRGTEDVSLTTKFRTDTLSTFPVVATCRVYVYDQDWVGGIAGTATMIPTALGTTLTCQGVYAVPAALAAGRYWIFVEATDSSGDIVRSNAQSFLKCENADVGTGACADADVDVDGTPEGRFTPTGYASPPTPTYFGAPFPRACDNCINFHNPNQRDENANGIGDSCEAGLVGRCKYKYCGESPDDLTPGGVCSADTDCAGDDLCVIVDQPMCTVNCAVDADCSPPVTSAIGVCSLDWGACGAGAPDEGSCCFSNADCLSNECKALVKPFVETVSGQVYSGGEIQAGEAPPIYNATYCLQSGGLITNFTSELGCALSGSTVYEIPKPEKNYVGSFGAIDVNGILNGKYGALLQPGSLPDRLDGKIYYFPSGLTIGAPIEFKNSSGAARANGLVIVKGDLVIDGDLTYQDRNESDLKNLASIGWIVLRDGAGGGNVYVGPTVNRSVGAFFAEETIDTGGGTTPFEATGVFVAKKFEFKREYASRTSGSERVIFDARVILNPPPGLSDATRSLPGFRSTAGR
ncbi:MAG: hypothetical protein AAB554_00440 [Patescibacteria group bacterium]